MIFVTLGTQKFQLNRLLIEIDELIEKRLLKEEIFAQIGNSTYKPKNFAYSRMLSNKKYDKMIEECDLLITHSGVGTILKGLKLRKKVIVYPRYAKYKEHVDDHQLEIAEAFCKKGYILMCDKDSSLLNVIRLARDFKSTYKEKIETSNRILEFLLTYLGGDTSD